ncbi:cell division protein FtsL [Natranaerobius thermophilus]|uniref:cell division protein FtsL n=1 Tax=Natranaerobius thermophilus TaxID=375929 RepID=UPI0001666ADF|nr:cell division protein FtsL [Natranaerobius thermophilus]
MYKNQVTAEAIPKTHRQTAPQRSPQERKKTRSRPVAVPKTAKIKFLGVAFCAFALAMLTVAHFAFVAQLNFQISQLENELEELHNEKNHLEMKIVELKSHQRIEQYAKEELEMKRPESK